MSWDVWLFRAPGVESVDQLGRDYQFPPIDRSEVLAAATSVFVNVEAMGWIEDRATFDRLGVDRASFLRIDGPDVYAEIALPDESGDQSAMGSVTVNVHGGSDKVIDKILEFATSLDARCMDLQRGDWLIQADDSFPAWSAYRDHVVNQPPNG